jgi:hypothetical protein
MVYFTIYFAHKLDGYIYSYIGIDKNSESDVIIKYR